MNLQEEAKTWITHNLCDGWDRSKAEGDCYPYSGSELYEVTNDLAEHLGEVVINALEDLAYEVYHSTGPLDARDRVETLISEIKANASAESEDKPIAEDPKV